MNKRCFYVLLLLASLPAAGCSRDGDRKAANGTVFLNGMPLESGTISFRPLGTKGNSSGSKIEKGEFVIAADKGLLPGKYEVTVRSFKPTGRTVRDPEVGDIPELAPVRFRETTLETTISASESNRFEFNLTSAR